MEYEVSHMCIELWCIIYQQLVFICEFYANSPPNIFICISLFIQYRAMNCIGSLDIAEPLLACDFVDVSSARQYVFIVLSTPPSTSKSVVVIYDAHNYKICAECHCPTR